MTRLGQMLRQDGIEEGMQLGLEKGMQIGIEKGTENEKCRYSSLIIYLMEAKKEKLLVEAAANPELLEALYREYQL